MSSNQVMVEEHPSQPVLAVRLTLNVKDLQPTMAKYYPEIMAYIMELGHEPAGMPYAGYHNMDMENLDVEIGIPTKEKLPAKDDIKPAEIPGGRYAVSLHIGPYDNLSETYNRIIAWLPENQEEPGGPAYEFYMNDPGEVVPEKLETMVAFLLK